jgi:Tol biopolymer transport system component
MNASSTRRHCAASLHGANMHRTKKSAVMAFALPVVMLAARTPREESPLAAYRDAPATRSGRQQDGPSRSRAPAETQRLVIRSLDGRVVRLLPLLGESNQVPVWSPDGESIAFQVRENGRNVIAVVRSDGNAPRVYHDAVSATGQSAHWSPDSRSIGFLDPGRHEFRLLTIATGSIRSVSADSGAQVGVWRWRPDGRSIAAVMTAPGTSPGLRFLRRRVDEISLEGARRPLLDTTAMRGVPGATFIDAYTIFVRYDSAAYRIPLTGGPPRRLSDLAGSVRPSAGVHTTAPSSQVWAGLIPGDLLESGRVEFISAQTGERRQVLVPFHPSAGPSPEWTPDGRALVVVGWPLEDTTGLDDATIRLARERDTSAVRQVLARSTSATVLYRVPVDGGAPSLIAKFRATDWWISVSPDGKYVVHGMIDDR